MAWRSVPAKLNRPTPPLAPPGAVFGLKVLASGSSGNCAVLFIPGDDPSTAARMPSRVCLIDAGLSPSRTRALLAQDALDMRHVDDIVLTHLDADHFHGGWRRVRDCRATLRMHRRHLGRAERAGLLLRRNEPFLGELTLGERVHATTTLLSHDELGVAAFRFDVSTPAGKATLGYATDLGHVTLDLLAHLRGVDVLAIESNYCPEMQKASDRPAFLKKRIMGGKGHLSNQECAQAVADIGPAQHLVFLHMSRQCNTPARIEGFYADSGTPRTISRQDETTDWIWAMPSAPADPQAHTKAESQAATSKPASQPRSPLPTLPTHSNAKASQLLFAYSQTAGPGPSKPIQP